MAVLIKAIQRVNPLKPTDPKKWYVTQVTTAQVDETQVALDLSDETTLNASEAMMALRQLRKVVIHRLLGGESVKFANWGSFNLSLSSTPSLTKDGLTARNIKSVNINFQPDEAFKAELQKATFAWVDKLAEGRSSSSNATSDSGTSSNGSSDGTDTGSSEDSGSSSSGGGQELNPLS